MGMYDLNPVLVADYLKKQGVSQQVAIEKISAAYPKVSTNTAEYLRNVVTPLQLQSPPQNYPVYTPPAPTDTVNIGGYTYPAGTEQYGIDPSQLGVGLGSVGSTLKTIGATAAVVLGGTKLLSGGNNMGGNLGVGTTNPLTALGQGDIAGAIGGVLGAVGLGGTLQGDIRPYAIGRMGRAGAKAHMLLAAGITDPGSLALLGWTRASRLVSLGVPANIAVALSLGGGRRRRSGGYRRPYYRRSYRR